MNNLDLWAMRHHVSAEAMTELRMIWVSQEKPDVLTERRGEAYVQSRVMLEAAQRGVILFRNNVGVLMDSNGRPVRYGLANESKKRNESLKSADLIGIRPVLITAGHVGKTIGQFVSIECKRPDWKPGQDKEREEAQQNWATLVGAYGGFAAITNGESGL